MIATSGRQTSTFALGTDPVAAAVRVSLRPAAFPNASRTGDAPSRPGGPLNLAALYPDLYAPSDAPAGKSLRAIVGLMAEIASAFRGASAPIR